MGFKKGQGGRPKGATNKVVADVRSLAQAYSAEALARLAFWMRSDNATASVAAADKLLDRAHGKPAQALTNADGGPLIPALVEHRHVHDALPMPDEPRALPPVRPS